MEEPMKEPMKEIVASPEMVAYCGLYCGACKSFLKGKCPGCHENIKASWCGIRNCCMENNYLSCAECKTFRDIGDCKNFNNVISKVIGFLLRSDRRACIEQIRELGLEGHARDMALRKRQTIRPA